MKKSSRLFSILFFAIISLTGLTAIPSFGIETAFETDHSLPIVNINVAIRTGAVSDPAGQAGLTNFMGEMLLRGTKNLTKEQIDLALDQMGAKLEVETRSESMILRGSVLGSQLAPFLKLVQELLIQASFPDVEIKKLKSEVISGLLEEQGNDPALANRKFTQFLFGNNPYGKPILGTIRDIKNLRRDEIVAHYDALVRDPLLLVVGSGDADQGTIKSWSKDLAQARPQLAKLPDQFVVPTPVNAPARRLQIVDKPTRTQTQINGGQIGVRMTDSSFFPLYLGNYAFGGGSFSARLMVEIRVKRGWSYGANSIFRHGLKPRSWHFHLFPASKDTAAALALSLQLVQDLKNKGITPEEFDFAKRSLVNSAGFMYDTPKKRVENTLLERTLDLPEGFMKSYGPELSKVELAQVNRALSDFLKPEHLAISVLGTAAQLKVPLAKAAGVPVEQVEVIPYTAE